MVIVDQMGHATANQILEQMKGVCNHNVGKYCSRDVGLGLLSADRSGYQIVYSTQYDWREKIAARDPRRGEARRDGWFNDSAAGNQDATEQCVRVGWTLKGQ